MVGLQQKKSPAIKPAIAKWVKAEIRDPGCFVSGDMTRLRSNRVMSPETDAETET
jgi:hypothetical protein